MEAKIQSNYPDYKIHKSEYLFKESENSKTIIIDGQNVRLRFYNPKNDKPYLFYCVIEKQ
jgi:hypothetical protein